MTECWTMVSAIATATMAIATFVTIIISLWQNKESQRARLIFSIVRKDDYVCLKVENIGNTIASDIHMSFSQNFKEMLICDRYRENYTLLEETSLSIAAHDKKYYHIVPVAGVNAMYDLGDKKLVGPKDIDEWHKRYAKVKFRVSGKYCSRYKIAESMSIHAFLNVGAVDVDELLLQLKKQNEQLRYINSSLMALQEAHRR